MVWVFLRVSGDTFLGVTELPPKTGMFYSHAGHVTRERGGEQGLFPAGSVEPDLKLVRHWQKQNGNVTGLWKEEERTSEKGKSNPYPPGAEQSCAGTGPGR